MMMMADDDAAAANSSSSLERKTLGQTSNNLWVKNRSVRLTSSNFYNVIHKKLKSAGQLYYHKDLSSLTPIQYGILYEDTALRTVSNFLEKKLDKCGLFVPSKFPFLGASPDAVLDSFTIIEVKCPFSKRYSSERPEYLIERPDGTFKLKSDHSYFYQCQGQMLCSQRLYCIFAAYTPKITYICKVIRDDRFIDWLVVNLKKYYLETFYPFLVAENVEIPQQILNYVAGQNTSSKSS